MLNMRCGPVLCLAFALAMGVFARTARAQDIVITEMRLPTHSAGKKGLEAVMVRPNDGAPHPLALMTHGTPREAEEREKMTPLRWIPQAREFARRGWTTVIVMRRGFGDSGGGYEEEGRACSGMPNYYGATKESVKDLREAAAYLRDRPEVDPSRMISVGVSTGGLAMVGLAADPPPGLLAAISFAGGRGSQAPDHVCNPEALVDTFAEFGRHSKVPMLWIYSANDHFFGPTLAQAFYRAFAQSGGNAKFVVTGAFGEDGHQLFSLAGIPVWTPIVDDFLQSQNLVLRDTLLTLSVPNVDPPNYLSADCNLRFQRYLSSAPHKAFTASSTGHCGVSVGQRSSQEAEKDALANCRKFGKDQCATVMLDDEKPSN
jgi:dienelactone hydrolase